MTVPDVLRVQLGEVFYSGGQFSDNLQRCLDGAIRTFERWIDEHSLESLDQSEMVAEEYVRASQRFWKEAGAVEAAISLLLDGSDRFASLQKKKGVQIPRGTIFNELFAIHYHILNDLGAATWWALHTQADQVFIGRTHDVGRNMLQTTLGVSEKAVNALNDIVDDKKYSTYEGKKVGFAEDIVVRFVLEKRIYSYILGRNSIAFEYPISNAYFATLLDDVDKKREGNSEKKQKGNALEKLAAYLFLLIPGWLPLRNVQDEKQTSEIDLVVRNLQPNANLMADVFGRYFIVECKNWENPVGSRDVGYFLNKIRQSHASFGIVFSKEGITGDDEEEKAAKELTRRAFHEDRNVCIVISHEDLERLERGEITFRALLFDLYEEFRFGRPKSAGG